MFGFQSKNTNFSNTIYPISNTSKIGNNFTSLPYITNGLQLYLDAGNRGSYSGTGTTWTDLSGNNYNGTLTNGPTFNSDNEGSIVLDGTDDYVNTPNVITSVTALTIMGFIYRNGSQNLYSGLFFSRASGVTGLNIYPSNTLGYTWNDNPNTYNYNSGLAIPNTTWCMVALAADSTNAILYLNTSSATNNVANTTTSISTLRIGVDSGQPNRYFNGRIGNVLIYNRKLSTQEITDNYNAFRLRFGI